MNNLMVFDKTLIELKVTLIEYMDLTNAIYIRDGYGSDPTNAIPQNRYLALTEEIFKMQPVRKINKIVDNVPL